MRIQRIQSIQALTFQSSQLSPIFEQTAELVGLIRWFQVSGLEVVALKGPVLALELYGDIGARRSADLDLVVRPENIFQADTLLREQGYERAELTPRQLQAHLFWSKDFVYKHPMKKICVELHWRLFQDWGLFSVFDTPLQISEIAGVCVKHLSPEYNLLYLCTHGCESGWSQPKWAMDIQKLLEKYGESLDWSLVWNEAEKWDLTRALQEGLSPPLKKGGQGGFYIWRLSDWLHKLWLRKKLINKFRVVRSLLVPRAQDFKALELPDGLFWLYYLLRPLLALRRNRTRFQMAKASSDFKAKLTNA